MHPHHSSSEYDLSNLQCCLSAPPQQLRNEVAPFHLSQLSAGPNKEQRPLEDSDQTLQLQLLTLSQLQQQHTCLVSEHGCSDWLWGKHEAWLDPCLVSKCNE